ncbi:MAG: LPP20 family lipoprotein, partial [Anaerolineales bacterium]|nr:LPP20 family lipoprotein [Anaerolineales bacterium]
MNLISKALTLGTISLLLWSCGSSSTPSVAPSEPKPAWLMERPIDPNYYIGIGSAVKNQSGAEAQKSAQDLALADLASQITVTISSDIVTTLIEKGEFTEEEYLATARSQAVADLEGHELVDSWHGQHYQYAYYRLSKTKYAAIQARKRQAALGLALDFLQKAQAADELNNFSEAFSASVQAFIPLIPYLIEALKTNIAGRSVIMSNEVNQFINTLVTDITLSPNQSNVSGKLGKPISEKLLIHAKTASGRSIRNLPLRIHFKRGSGELLESINTGSRGFAETQVSAITSGQKIQVLEATVDLNDLLSEALSPILKSIINSIPLTTARIIIDVSNPTIYLESVEVFNGESLKQLQVEPKLKNHFIQQGFHFVDKPAQADWQMTLTATATQGAEFSG